MKLSPLSETEVSQLRTPGLHCCRVGESWLGGGLPVGWCEAREALQISRILLSVVRICIYISGVNELLHSTAWKSK